MNKTIMSKFGALLLVAASAAGFVSCQNDDFEDGQGTLQLQMKVSATLTRSNPDNLQDLQDNATIYLSSSKGLIYKWKGVDNLPASIPLKTGAYVAEAWAGDSVAASFDKKFYRGYQPFEIERGDVKNVTVNCQIANVVVAVAPDASVAEVLDSYKVTVSHSKGSLEFTSGMDEATRGYFMMPNADTALTWVLEGEDKAGNAVRKEGKIEGVQRAHEYTLNLHHNGGDTEPFGGGLITVTIDDRCLIVEDVVTITGAPQITGVGFDLEAGLSGEPGKFERRSIYVECIGSLSSLKMHTEAASALGLPVSDFDLVSMDDVSRGQIAAAGISAEVTAGAERSSARIFFEAAMLNKLGEGEYPIELTATDSNGKKRVRTLKIQVTDADVKLVESPWTDIYATKATLRGTTTKDGATGQGFRYRKQGTADWTEVTGTLAGVDFSATVTGLTPGTTYEYQAISTGHVNTSTLTFTTESKFILPNAGFEDWSQSGKVIIPSASGNVEWWDSGNHGSATMNKNITQGATNLFHSGAKSAYLKSQFVGIGSIGAFAAGNIFAGSYDKTDGTNGELTFGRAFNGSRPVKLTGYCYYKPATVQWSKTDKKPKGEMDEGIIYVALTTGTSKILTKTAQLFNPDGDDVIAYGEIVFTEEFGSSSEMRKFEITLQPKKLYNLSKATYIVLTASASRYGDYFTGGESEMYLDDLQLEY